jgi:hypothetical protein
MKFVIVIECADSDTKDVARVLREAPKNLGGLGEALVQMPANAAAPGGPAQRPRSEAAQDARHRQRGVVVQHRLRHAAEKSECGVVPSQNASAVSAG